MEQEYIAGKNSVIEALRSGRTIHKLWLSESANKSAMQPILAEAKNHGVIAQFVDRRKLDQFAQDGNHQGVVAQVAAYEYVELEDLIAAAQQKSGHPFFLLLDEIEDPHNLGSILRTADCSGADGVIIPKRRSVGLTGTVAKTSAGAVEYVPVARVTNLAQTIDRLKEAGIWIVGTDASADQEVYGADFNLPVALVIGSEGQGMGRLIKEKCDFIVRLPMFGHVNSLNASVASGILMYEIVRQRHTIK